MALDERQLHDSQQSAAEEQQSEKDSDKKKDESDDDDGGSVNAALGLINSGPVQLKNDLEQPVTSGGMDTMIENPGNPD